MDVTLWIVQALLALLFAFSAAMKAVASKDWLVASGQTGVTHYASGFIRFIGLCELAGAVGLVAPWLTGIAPALTPVAAAALGVLMIGASRAHARLAREHPHDPPRHRRERRNQRNNFILLALCLFVAVGRATMLYAP
jgi:hypothetical protein